MNRKELVEKLYKEHGLPKAFFNSVLDTIFDTISGELKKGNLVRLRNFGTFQARKSHGKIRPKFNPSKNFFK